MVFADLVHCCWTVEYDDKSMMKTRKKMYKFCGKFTVKVILQSHTGCIETKMGSYILSQPSRSRKIDFNKVHTLRINDCCWLHIWVDMEEVDIISVSRWTTFFSF